jgi:hypothetical protein
LFAHLKDNPGHAQLLKSTTKSKKRWTLGSHCVYMERWCRDSQIYAGGIRIASVSMFRRRVIWSPLLRFERILHSD